jgi:hypothetical protein
MDTNCLSICRTTAMSPLSIKSWTGPLPSLFSPQNIPLRDRGFLPLPLPAHPFFPSHRRPHPSSPPIACASLPLPSLALRRWVVCTATTIPGGSRATHLIWLLLVESAPGPVVHPRPLIQQGAKSPHLHPDAAAHHGLGRRRHARGSRCATRLWRNRWPPQEHRSRSGSLSITHQGGEPHPSPISIVLRLNRGPGLMCACLNRT